MTQILDIAIQAEGWPDCTALAERAIAAVQAQMDSPRLGELSLVLSNDAEIQALNKTYRDKDRPTNVLSFPQSGPLLGDIVLARETITREADEKAISFEFHVTHLIIHGWLHLQGFDHQTDETAAEMEAIEISALAALGIQNPYQAPYQAIDNPHQVSDD